MSGRDSEGDRGAVTAELAACLPVLMLLVAFAVGLVTVGGARVRAADAAREAARAAARGDRATGLALAASAAPGGSVSITTSGDEVTATVRLPARVVGWLPGVTITERAVAAVEPSDGGPSP